MVLIRRAVFMSVGESVKRVDAFDKVTGRARYTDDLCVKNALVAKILHSGFANGLVKSVDVKEAESLPGVVKVITCFDVPDIAFPTAGHPWSTDPSHQDVADRHLLTKRVRYYGDDIAAVIAVDEIVHQRHGILLGIPQQLCYHPALQLYELRLTPLRGRAFLEYALNVIA